MQENFYVVWCGSEEDRFSVEVLPTMLVVRIELWPNGWEEQKKVLGEARIVNDMTGSVQTGNYKAVIRGKRGTSIAFGSVCGFKRKRFGAWYLLAGVLERLLGSDIPKAWRMYPPPSLMEHLPRHARAERVAYTLHPDDPPRVEGTTEGTTEEAD